MAYTYAKPAQGYVDAQGFYHQFVPTMQRRANAVSGLRADAQPGGTFHWGLWVVAGGLAVLAMIRLVAFKG